MQPEANAAIVPRHSDEMTGKFELRIGSRVSLSIAAQATPAALVAVGVLVSSITLSVVPVVWAAWRRR